jgi:hypothetical protein
MSYIPAALAIDPAAFISTIFAAVAAFLSFLIVLLSWCWCADRVQRCSETVLGVEEIGSSVIGTCTDRSGPMSASLRKRPNCCTTAK